MLTIMPDMIENVTTVSITPQTLRTSRQLRAANLILENEISAIDAVRAKYTVAIPESVVSLIDQSNPNDPIARQFVPSPAELKVTDDEAQDPIGDLTHSPMPGLVHRYPDRVLLTPTLSCPVYCRYCFRRDRVGRSEGAPNRKELDAAIRYIECTLSIREVILTGGDPLSLSDKRLEDILNRVVSIRHIQHVRIHTRFPIVVPKRVTNTLIKALQTKLPIWLVLHTNHPKELTSEVGMACAKLSNGGVPLLSQSVLLKGVNDDVEVLAELMRSLVRLKIKPYYLHHPDRAQGTAQFRISIETGKKLVKALRGRISGLCQPNYVVDIPGGHGKVLVDSAYRSTDGNTWILENFEGRSHKYND
ncbi:MAG: lysine-2,3-aminomutase-like protein [Pseudomonadota bacterium]|nr:lysine-2,3-aminomutase-like protein [Pseudomonadota bacterium]